MNIITDSVIKILRAHKIMLHQISRQKCIVLTIISSFQDTLLDAAGTVKCFVIVCKKKISKGDGKAYKENKYKENLQFTKL